MAQAAVFLDSRVDNQIDRWVGLHGLWIGAGNTRVDLISTPGRLWTRLPLMYLQGVIEYFLDPCLLRLFALWALGPVHCGPLRCPLS